MSEMITDLRNVSMEGEVGGGTTEQYDDQLAEKEEHVCHAEKDVEKKIPTIVVFFSSQSFCEIRIPNFL